MRFIRFYLCIFDIFFIVFVLVNYNNPASVFSMSVCMCVVGVLSVLVGNWASNLSEAVLWHYVGVFLPPAVSLTTSDIWDAAEVQTLSSAAPFISERAGGWPKGVNLTSYDTPAWAWGVGLGVKGTAGDQVDRCTALVFSF